jgi:hypothetical protein
MKSVSLIAIATGSESSHWPYLPEIPWRKLLVENGAGSRALCRLPGLAQVRALGRGFDVRVRGVFADVHVTQVAEHVHRFVVAEHDVQLPAGGPGLALQSHQQVQDLARIGAAVEQVAQAHDVRPSGCPAVLRIDDAGFAEQRDQFGVGAVHVGERDHSIHAAPLHLSCLSRRRYRPGEAGDCSETEQRREREPWQTVPSHSCVPQCAAATTAISPASMR